MSVKAREVVKRESVSYKQLILIFLVLFIFQLFMSYIQKNVSQDIAFIVNIISTIISLILLFLVISKILPRYEFMIVDNNFIISKALLFKPKIVYSINLSNIESIKKEVAQSKKKGRKRRYTLYGIKDKINYLLEINEGKNNYYIVIQASNKFIDKLEKTIKKVGV